MMSQRIAIACCVLGALLLVGAGVLATREGPSPEAICARGADKVILCIAQTSRSAAELSRSRRDDGILACKEDPDKVARYRECLAHEDCSAFMTCAAGK